MIRQAEGMADSVCKVAASIFLSHPRFFKRFGNVPDGRFWNGLTFSRSSLYLINVLELLSPDFGKKRVVLCFLNYRVLR